MIPLLLALAGAFAQGVPEQLAYQLQIHSGPMRCWGTPIGIVQVISAAHCAGSGEVEWVGRWDGKEHRGIARLMWRDDGHEKGRDIAMFSAFPVPGWPVVVVAKTAPLLLEPVFWRFYLRDQQPAAARGVYVGQDGDDDMGIDGLVPLGSSGAGVLNAAGELVGVITMGGSLDGRSRAIGYAEAIVGWPKPGGGR